MGNDINEIVFVYNKIIIKKNHAKKRPNEDEGKLMWEIYDEVSQRRDV